jgi:hypothetical protein
MDDSTENRERRSCAERLRNATAGSADIVRKSQGGTDTGESSV